MRVLVKIQNVFLFSDSLRNHHAVYYKLIFFLLVYIILMHNMHITHGFLQYSTAVSSKNEAVNKK